MYRRNKERKGQSPSREKRTQKSGSFSKKATSKKVKKLGKQKVFLGEKEYLSKKEKSFLRE